MTPRTAMILAITSGALAVALVAVDLQFGVHVELQENVDGQWVAVAGNFEERYPSLPGCAGPELRLVVNNDRLFAYEAPVRISYFQWDGDKGETVTVLQATWHIPARGVQDHAFTLPESAFGGSGDPRTHVDVQVGDHYLGTCVEADA